MTQQINHFCIDCQTTEEIVNASVMELHSVADLKSERLGADQGICLTCNNVFENCRGHNGYIKTKYAYINPMLSAQAKWILQRLCLCCFKLSPDKKDKKNPPCCKTPRYLQMQYYNDINPKIVQFIRCGVVDAYRLRDMGLYGRVQKRYVLSPDQPDCLVLLNPNVVFDFLQTAKLNIPFQQKILKGIMLMAVPVCSLHFRTTNQASQTISQYNQIYQRIIEANNTLFDFDFIEGVYRRDKDLYGPHKRVTIANANQHPAQRFVLAWQYLQVAIRVILYRETSKTAKPQISNQMLAALNLPQNNQEPHSLLSASVSKDGIFRQTLSAVRVNKSSRTVITGRPYIDSSQVVCPLDIAKTITVPIRVNDVNIRSCRELLENFPTYPCVLHKQSPDESYTTFITSKTKEKTLQNLKVGDILFRQVMDNDICLTNRYPSIREESFGSHTVIVRDIKSIQFNLQVVKKMTADFDGDEMQLYFMTSQPNNVELALLSSMVRQLITYETGSTLIGGCPDLDCGIFYIQKELSYQKDMERIINQFVPHIDYDDGDIQIADGQLQHLSSKICGSGSRFITYVSQEYGGHIALQMMDELTRCVYRVNEKIGSSLYNDIFKPMCPEMKRISDQRTFNANNIIEALGQGKYASYHQYQIDLHNALCGGVSQQKAMLKQFFADQPTKGTYYNKLIQQREEEASVAMIELGQLYDEDGSRLQSETRTLPCYDKFDQRVETQGYVKQNYVYGVDQTAMFLGCMQGRKQLFVKGNSVAKDGYTYRRLSKGTDTAKTSFQQFVMGDSDTVVSLQYGSAGYDPRCYHVIKFPYHKWSREQLFAKFGTATNAEGVTVVHPFLEDIYQIAADMASLEQQMFQADYNFQGMTHIVAPFRFSQKSVSSAQLNMLWQCRLTFAMTDDLMDIMQQQVLQFYTYALFNSQVDERSTYDIVGQYLRSIVSAGETVGAKAGVASTQPYTQLTLCAIHSHNSGGVMLEWKSTGGIRFMELVTNSRGPTVFQTQLLGAACRSEAITNAFISKHQTYGLQQLGAKFEVYYVCTAGGEGEEGCCKFDIKIPLLQLALFDIKLQQLVNQLRLAQMRVEVQPLQEGDTVVCLQCLFVNEPRNQKKIFQFIRTEQQFGSKFMYNLRAERKPDGHFVIVGNFKHFDKNTQKSYLQDLLCVRGVDQHRTYCSDPQEYLQLFGIQHCHNSLYNELSQNLSSIEVTKEVQKTHVKLLSDILTQTGQYTNFTRNSFKSQYQKDSIQLLVFEQGDWFIQNEMLNPRVQRTDTMLNSQLFGSRASIGTTYTQIGFHPNQIIKQQDVNSLLEEASLASLRSADTK